MKSLELSSIFTSLGSDMDCGPLSYRFCTIVLLFVKNFPSMLPYTTRMLDICSYGVLMSCMWYTKRILVYSYFCSGLAGTLSSSNPPSSLRWLDLSSDIGFLPVVELPTNPLPMVETSVVIMDILSVVIVN
jgi:hypothetical protein